MSWNAIARKDFSDAIRAWSLLTLSALFVLFAAAAAALYGLLGGGQGGVAGLVNFVGGPAGLFVSITALVVGHRAIVGERESGSLKLLMGLPHTRAEVLLGKVVGRTLVVVAPLLAGFVVAAVVAAALYAQFSLAAYAVFVALTCIFALAYVSVAVSISTLTASGARATAGAVAFWVLAQFLWGVLPVVVFLALRNGLGMANLPMGPFQFVAALSPAQAFGTATNLVTGAAAPPGAPTPFYSEPWFGLLVLWAWVVLPVLVGYWRFESADLS